MDLENEIEKIEVAEIVHANTVSDALFSHFELRSAALNKFHSANDYNLLMKN